MSKKLEELLKISFRKGMTKVLTILFGLPTFIVAYILYVGQSSKEKARYQEIYKEAQGMLEADGTLDRLRAATKEHLITKFNYFNEEATGSKFEEKLKKQIAVDEKEAITKKVDQLYREKGEEKGKGFVSFLADGLKNPVLLVLSFITSFPMYILLLIYSNPFTRYIFNRIVLMILVAFGVVFVVFTILHLSASDPAMNVLGEAATPDQVATFNRVYGLDKPYIIQLFTNFKKLATFNLGNSYLGNEDVMQAIFRKFPTTMKLGIYSFIIAVVVSIPVGIISAVKPNTAFDYVSMFLALLGLSVPAFWFGMLLILNLSINTHILPAAYTPEVPISMLMPAVVLGLRSCASLARNTRSAMRDVLGSDYVVTAKAKGLPSNKVILKHALGNAMIPIVTIAGIQLGLSFGGSSITEKVFNIKGIGSYIVDKQFLPDIPAILGGVVYVSMLISVSNLIIDLLYVALDPRIKARLKNE